MPIYSDDVDIDAPGITITDGKFSNVNTLTSNATLDITLGGTMVIVAGGSISAGGFNVEAGGVLNFSDGGVTVFGASATITGADQIDPDTTNNTASATATPQQADLSARHLPRARGSES